MRFTALDLDLDCSICRRILLDGSHSTQQQFFACIAKYDVKVNLSEIRTRKIELNTPQRTAEEN